MRPGAGRSTAAVLCGLLSRIVGPATAVCCAIVFGPAVGGSNAAEVSEADEPILTREAPSVFALAEIKPTKTASRGQAKNGMQATRTGRRLCGLGATPIKSRSGRS